MTKSTLFTLLTLVVCSCGVTTEEEIEAILLDCLIEGYDENEVDILVELDTLEQFLIDTKTLNDATGQSYFDFYDQVAKTGEISSYVDQYRFEKIFKENPSEFYEESCLAKLKNFDSTLAANSKYGKLALGIQKRISKVNSPASVAKAITENLIPSDFEKPYYRAMALLTIAHTSDLGQELLRELKPIEKSDFTDFERIELRITAENDVFVNDNLSELNFARQEIIDFIRIHEENHVVNFKPEKGTSYQFYLEVQDIIQQAYKELRDELAQKQFNLPYSELSDEQKNTIKITYPTRIDESVNE